MAGIITHALFSINALEELNINYDLETLKVFSCGPDLFYANKKKYGKTLHRKKVNQFFENYINYIKQNQLEHNIEILSSLYGFISHYILDKTIHPFVFYKTGVFDPKQNNTFKYLDLHTKMEKYIDFIMLEKRNIKYRKWPAWKFLFKKINYSNDTIKLLNNIIEQTYGYPNGGYYYQKAIKKYHNSYKYICYDPLGIKYRIYQLIDMFRPNKPRLSLLSHYHIDIMNLNTNHRNWYHPVTNETFNTSIDDLLKTAKIEFKKIIIELNKVLFDNKDKTKLLKMIHNTSYINGLDSSHYHRMIYFEK